MVTPSGQVKVLDFGLAKLLDEAAAATSGIHRTELTEVGCRMEPPPMQRPNKLVAIASTSEQISSPQAFAIRDVDWHLPFRGKTTIDVRHAVLHGVPKTLSELRPGPLHPRLQPILDRALAKEPRDRYQKMEELRDDLRSVLQDVTRPRLRECPWQVSLPSRRGTSPAQIPFAGPCAG